MLPCLLGEGAGLVVHIQSCSHIIAGCLHVDCDTARPWTEHGSIMLSVACKVKSSSTQRVIRVTDKQLSRELGMRLPLGMCRVGTHHQSAADRDGWL